ncbi:hypothetical protein CC86DRAFT_423022 [Ophiobolus disseminans]|uniref:F-box domain-containing protein n=1 Tax=Ophiobolus disseminans TaxID=1469910 RepID=A0A6A6ZRR2_9PLEO|nr:hypothetical protein CC86DRAFT_423022 [Ophiobolus disseminans]
MTTFKLPRTTPPPLQSNQILFLTLPLELREQIYFHATFIGAPLPYYLAVSAADAIHGTDPRYPNFLPTLARINESTRIDVGLWFIRNTEFGLLYPQRISHFCAFLATFPNLEGFEAIRRLDCQLFGRYRPDAGEANAYIAFMLRCARLTQVRIKFVVWELLKRRFTHTRRMPRTPWELEVQAGEMLSVERIVEMYRLEEMFGLVSLTTLTIEFWPKATAYTTRGVRTVVPDCGPLLQKLVEWLRKGFAERGRDVRVGLVESGSEGLRWSGGSERMVMRSA